MFEMLHNLIF